jgi:hypothetical protein
VRVAEAEAARRASAPVATFELLRSIIRGEVAPPAEVRWESPITGAQMCELLDGTPTRPEYTGEHEKVRVGLFGKDVRPVMDDSWTLCRNASASGGTNVHLFTDGRQKIETDYAERNRGISYTISWKGPDEPVDSGVVRWALCEAYPVIERMGQVR